MVTVLNQLCKKTNEILMVSPNPANDYVTVGYKMKNVNEAKIRLIKTDNSIDRQYNVNLQSDQMSINVSDCPYGSYAIVLECDGVNVDSRIIIIQ